jgi:hypothetical protein
MSSVESNRYCQGSEKKRRNSSIFSGKKNISKVQSYVVMQSSWLTNVSYLKADRAVVVHCSFHAAMRILQDIAVATPC